ncbi:MAG: amino acid adenylation domain-containing protein [Candidatus Electrothrix scaldis]|nr:MAG: amino acid adenylation domain-containing protein [Candidatus Electrothrix sp. GW3-3]
MSSFLSGVQTAPAPDAIAIMAPERTPLKYHQLTRHISQVVETLTAFGVGRNDRVAIVLPNGPEMAVAFLAVAACTAAAPLNPSYRAEEYDFYLSDLNARALIIQPGIGEPAREAARARRIPIIELQPMSDGEAGLFTLTLPPAREKPGGCSSPQQADDIALVLHTSGTTSRPKIVPLTQSNLISSARNVSTTLRLTENDRCLNVMPLFHIHGLIGVLLSSMTVGAAVICTPGFYAPKFFEWVKAFCPTWYSAVPTMHQAILARASKHGEVIAGTRLRFIRSSSAALPPQVLADLENVFDAPVIEAYGMTEATHQMASNPLPPFLRKPGSVGMAAGPEVAVMDEAGHLLPSGTLGEIVIRGANITHGYENNPEANRTAFTYGWFRTGDQGYLDSEGYLFITGRLKEIINRGGEKISPREVDEILMDHPAVAQVVTFAMPHPQLGEEIAAAVVLREHASVAEKDLRTFAATRLVYFKVPRKIIILDKIPKGPTGKLQRIGLAEKLGLTGVEFDLVAEFIEPTTPMEKKLAAVWSEVLNVNRLGVHDNFFQLGGDSILVVQVIARLREVLHIELSFLVFFETPTVAAIAKHLETAERAAVEQSSVQPVPRNRELPLSFAQQRMWFLYQLEPGNPAYNCSSSLRLTGPLNVDALEDSLNGIIRRHEILRTHFSVNNGTPVQIITSNLNLTLSVTDLGDCPDPETEARHLAASEVRQSFDLTLGPLVRGRLLRITDEMHILLLTMHHIVFDGWSQGVLLRELATLYDAFCRDKPSPLAKLPVQYVDFASWQRQWQQGDTLSTDLSYWKQKLHGLSILNLPVDHPRATVQTFSGGKHSLVLSKVLSDSLRTLSRQENVTLFMTLLAAFQTLLYRYTGQDDITVGAPIAGRHLVETEELIGVFINTLVLRTDFSGSNTFLSLLARVRETALGAYNHQTLPFEKLVDELQPERDLSRTPLFQVLFQLRNLPNNAMESQGLRMDEFEFDTGIVPFDLTLDLVEKKEGISCVFMYNRDLFEEATIRRMAEHFAVLLKGIVENPETDIRKLPLLTATETEQLIAWNDTAAEYPVDKMLADLFEEQAEKTPENIAVVFENQQLAYLQLNDKANQLASALIEQGVQPDTLVGICAERSPEMIIGLLGILKAGGAYVPLDPDYPEERLRFMLQDCGAEILLTQTRLHERLPGFAGTLLDLDDPQLYAGRSAENPQRCCGSEHLAYVIYTSGSTGRPKGVCVPQRAVVRLVRGADYQSFNSDMRMGQASNTSFDAATYEIWGALLNGASLVHVPKDVLIRPSELGAYLREQAVSSMFVTTALFNQIARHQSDAFSGLDYLLFGGEQVDPLSVEGIVNADGPKNLLHVYGPTESTTYSTWHNVLRSDAEDSTIPIGRPIANTRIYILDANLRPLPPGIPGELCIAGAGLARGYLNRPELTAEKFVETEIFGKTERIYRTGDLARWLPDGNLEYLGRMDHQVKLRGFRIELGEIEAALTKHESVGEAVVVLREREGNKSLAAYLTVSGGTETDAGALYAELRTFLKASLPEYMVPASFTVLEKLPLTPNGKIDRKNLPEPDASEISEGAPLRTESEKLLAGLYSALLGTEVHSASAHFFELGGHSLLAARLVSRIRDSFGVEMPLRILFEHPAIAELAAWLDRQRRGDVLPPVEPQPENAPPVMSFAQERLRFLDRLEGQSATYNMPAALRLRGKLHIEALRQTFILLTERHQSLRMRFPDTAGTVEILPPYDPLSVTDMADLSADEKSAAMRERIRKHAVRPFDLETGPLLRLELLILGEQEHVLLFNMHHIISDGWSIGILLREWTEIHTALAEEREPELRPLPVQYSDYVAWQRQSLNEDVVERRLARWTEELTGAPQLLELPTDHPRPPVQSYRGAHLESRIDADLTAWLHELGMKKNSTLFMTLLAVFGVLLHKYSGQDDILIGSPTANRTQSQIEDLIGFFVNTLVLRARFEKGMSFSALLAQVRRTALEAFAYQDLPFERLVERLAPERSLSCSPLFQVMFALQNNEEGELVLPGLETELLEQDFPTAKFDLTLNAAERDGGLILHWEYAVDLFEEATIRRMSEHFAVLLKGIVEQPEVDISSLPLLTAAETEQLIAWNDTTTEYPADRTLADLFEEQAAKTPENIAVVFPSAGSGRAEDQQLTYRELNEKANQLAHALLELGVQADTLVGICAERSLEMIIGLLGILKAGGAYVPLDPDYPEERLRFMLQDCGAEILLTQTRLHERLPGFAGTLLDLDDPQLYAGRSAENPQRCCGSEHLAYVIYTSGSTGRPKGVCVPQRAVVRLVRGADYQSFNSDMRMGQASNTSFDAATYEIWGALLNGASLVHVPKDVLIRPSELGAYLREQAVSSMFVTTALFNQIARHQSDAFSGLDYLLFGGEQVDPLSVEGIVNADGPKNLLHVYGPTESTTYSTWHNVLRSDAEDSTIPIGRPIANTRIYILDANLRPLPPGIPGELCIAGAGLARGYLNRPDLTAEKFVEVELFGKTERIYRTGDLARWRADGNLEYLGRIDHQVKLRGFRIELGEIEAALTKHESVSEAVVVLREREGNKSLAAYLTVSGGTETDAGALYAELRTFLKASLPEYMVPASFTVLEKLPLTPNGKIDRKNLPEPDASEISEGAPLRTESEKLLAGLYSALLGTEVHSASAHFFELGGHSLLAARLVSRIRDSFGVEMPLRILFEHPAIAELAAWLDRQRRGDVLPPVEPQPENAPPVMSFAQERLRFLDRLEGQSATYNMPAALRLRGKLHIEALRQTFILLTERHQSLRMRFPDTVRHGGDSAAVRPAVRDGYG